MTRQLAGNRQRHAHHPALRCGVRRLPDLSVKRSHGCRVHDHAALAALERRVRAHHGRGEANHVECAGEIDAYHAHERVERMRSVFPENFLRNGDACGIHHAAKRAELGGGAQPALNARLVRHVDHFESGGGAKLAREARARCFVDVRNHDAAARRDDHPNGRLAKTGGAARHEKRAVIELLQPCSRNRRHGARRRNRSGARPACCRAST